MQLSNRSRVVAITPNVQGFVSVAEIELRQTINCTKNDKRTKR